MTDQNTATEHTKQPVFVCHEPLNSMDEATRAAYAGTKCFACGGSNTRDISPTHAAFSRSFSHLSFLLSFDCSVCRRGQAIRVSAKQIGRDLPREVVAAPLFIRKGQMVRREGGRCACIRRC